MLCRNCNYILSGTEDFCPHCGQATKTQEAETTQENEGISLNSANPHTANKGSTNFAKSFNGTIFTFTHFGNSIVTDLRHFGKVFFRHIVVN